MKLQTLFRRGQGKRDRNGTCSTQPAPIQPSTLKELTRA